MGTGEEHAFKGRVVKPYGKGDGNRTKNGAVCVAPSDDVVAICHGENVVVYKKTGEEAGKLAGHKAEVTCCSISHDLLATGSSKGIILLWKYREMKRVARIGLPCGPIHACALSVSGRYLAVSYADRKPRVYTLQGGDGSLLSGPTYKELEGHGKCDVTDMKFSTMSDDNLMTAARDGTVKFWKVEAGECLATVDLPEEGSILQAEFLRGTDVVLLTEKGGLSVFDLDTCQLRYNVPGRFKTLAASGGSCSAAVIDDADTLFIYNLAQQKEVTRKGTMHEAGIVGAAMFPSGQHFVTADGDGKGFLWD